jgi:hypothetical protein
MPLPLAIPIVMGTVALGGIIAGAIVKAKGQKKAQEMLEKARDEYGNIKLPQLEKIVAEEMGPSFMESIKVDPAYKEAQMKTMDTLKEISDQGGLRLQDEAVLNKFMNRVGGEQTARAGRFQQEMSERGIGGGGAELAMRQADQAKGTQLESEQAMDRAAMAQNRALDAIMARGNMAGQMRGQEFGEQTTVASAKDKRTAEQATLREKAKYQNAGNDLTRYNAELARQHGKAGLTGTAAQVQLQGSQDLGNAITKGGETIGNVGMGIYGQSGGTPTTSIPSTAGSINPLSNEERKKRGF